jgi:MFS transporter, PAT family, beta-lactamase induction signal transducer AmpG
MVGIGATLFAVEPARADAIIEMKSRELPLLSPRGLIDAIAGPFVVFFRTYGILALLMLAAISLYRLPDFVMGPMANPYYHDIGLSKDYVGGVRATIGVIAALLGIAAGGACALRLGYMRALIIGGVLQALAIAAFATLAYAKANVVLFATVMAGDNFSTGFAGVALVAYMSSLTSLGYTATQYALLSSTYAWLGKILKGFSGAIVESLSATHGLMDAYAIFFVGAGAIGIPAILLFLLLEARQRPAALAAP